MLIRTYSELMQHSTFDERYEYLKLGGSVGSQTFGFDRYLNQNFYRSTLWKNIRREIIIRDNGCDLGVPGYEIHTDLLVHHINPMVVDDLVNEEEWVLNPDFLITTTIDTHNAIHYGNRSSLRKPYVARAPGDTKLW